jgi:hypothetical protein
MLDQKVKVPVELNLDHENFPNERADLPEDLLELEKSNPLFTIYFDRDNDAHCWQKMVPTWNRHNDQQLILITADDDIQYPQNYVERTLECLNGHDWLCTTNDEFTFGQYMAYGCRAVEFLRREVDDEIVFQCPLDDHAIFWIMQKYGLKRGKAPFPNGWDKGDRELGYSFRRCFIQNDDPSKVRHGDYPMEQFIREREIFKRKGIV